MENQAHHGSVGGPDYEQERTGQSQGFNQNKLDQMNLHAAIPVLKKPFEPHDLKNIVRDSMNHSTNQ